MVFANSSVGKLPQFAFTERRVGTVNGLKQFCFQFRAVFFRVEHDVLNLLMPVLPARGQSADATLAPFP